MIHTGRTQELQVLRRTNEALILGDKEGSEVELPTNEHPGDAPVGSTVRVFVYRDQQGRHVATTRPPKVQVGGSAQLRVHSVKDDGALVEWGLEPKLFVPIREQKKALVEGRWTLVRLALDKKTDRIFGSTRIEDFLDNRELSVRSGEEVALVVYARTDLGFSVIVNDKHHGLLHHGEVFKPISIGDRLTGYVREVREDNKLDITLQAIGYRQFIDTNVALLARRLQAQGILHLTDKSSAEEIHAEFGISKKAFKKALGALYKERKVRIGEDAIVWMD